MGLLGSFGWDMMNPRCVRQTQGPPQEVEGHDVGNFSRLPGEGLSPAFYLPFTFGEGEGQTVGVERAGMKVVVERWKWVSFPRTGEARWMIRERRPCFSRQRTHYGPLLL